jgi:hypothetical protein
MKETFQPNDICLCKSAEEMKELIEYARERGVPISQYVAEVDEDGFEDNPILGWCSDYDRIDNYYSVEQGFNLTPEQFRLKCDNWAQPTPKEQTFSEGLAEIREAVADYMRSEGCSCCEDIEAHEQHKARLAKLLNVEPYSDGSGYDFQKWQQFRKEGEK